MYNCDFYLFSSVASIVNGEPRWSQGRGVMGQTPIGRTPVVGPDPPLAETFNRSVCVSFGYESFKKFHSHFLEVSSLAIEVTALYSASSVGSQSLPFNSLQQ